MGTSNSSSYSKSRRLDVVLLFLTPACSWTKSQVEARSHPNMLAVQSWLNNLYHPKSGQDLTGVDLSTSLSYADRFRIRHPGGNWTAHPPHVDGSSDSKFIVTIAPTQTTGGSIERWEDPTFRTVFEDILNGNWRQHDAFALGGRISARHSMYRRPNQVSLNHRNHFLSLIRCVVFYLSLFSRMVGYEVGQLTTATKLDANGTS